MAKFNFQLIEMKRLISNIEMLRKWRQYAFALCLAVLSFDAAAQFNLQLANVIDSYGACSWRNNGDGTSTINVTLNYRTITGNLGKNSTGALRPDIVFNSRGILVYTYDKTGKMKPSSAAAKYVAINGVKHSKSFTGSGYVMYYGSGINTPLAEWDKKEPFTADVEVHISNAAIKDWPAVAIRAGNFTSGDDVGEITGGAYLSSLGSANACQVVDPTVPPPKPPPALTVDMTAPDWNLGELPRGEYEKTLAGSTDQLCFTYTGVESHHNFVIDATSENGVSGNHYLLKNISKPTQTVPYSVTLDSGTARFPLPNIGNSAVTLNNAMRTCFIPTFKTSVDMSVDPGDYSDVLSFTVVTKS